LNHGRPNSDDLNPEDLFRPEPPRSAGGGTIQGEVVQRGAPQVWPSSHAGAPDLQVQPQAGVPWGEPGGVPGDPGGDPGGHPALPGRSAPAAPVFSAADVDEATQAMPSHTDPWAAQAPTQAISGGYGSPEQPGAQAQPTQMLPPQPDWGSPDYATDAAAQAAPTQAWPQQPPAAAPGYGAPAPTAAYGAPAYPQSGGYPGAPGSPAGPGQVPGYGSTPVPGFGGGYDNGGYGNGYGDGYDQGPRRSRFSPKAIAITVVAACAVIGVCAAAALSGGSSGTPSADGTAAASSSAAAGSGDAQAQAQALSDLLGTAASSRSEVIAASSAIAHCKDLDSSIAALHDAAGQRRTLVSKLGALQVDQLPDGAQLVTLLTQGWQASASADEHYAAWGTGSKGSCAGKKHKPAAGGERNAAIQASGTASEAKKKAASLWNAIAAKYGLPTRDEYQL